MSHKKPNIIFLITDQHRAMSTGCYQQTDAKTPYLDALAKRSVLFTNAYCPYPQCVASRQSIITGQYPNTHGCYGINLKSIDYRQWTLPRAFAEAGYETGLIGKSHCNENGFTLNKEYGKYWQQHWTEEEKRKINPPHFGFKYNENARTAGPCTFEEKYQQHDYVRREAIKYLEQEHEKPFFAFISFDYPHPPFNPPQRFWDLFDPDKLTLPPTDPARPKHPFWKPEIFTEQMRRNYLHGYYACLACADWCIGEIMKTAEAQGYLENSIIIYTSDHGENGGYHGNYEKHTFYEPSIKIPLIIGTPDTTPRRVAEIVELNDLAPTLTSLCRVDTGNQQFEGASLEGLLQGRVDGWKNTAQCEYYQRAHTETDGTQVPENFGRMLIEEGFKACVNGNMPYTNCLFDLKNDPEEMTNLWDDPRHTERRDRMLKKINTDWRKEWYPYQDKK